MKRSTAARPMALSREPFSGGTSSRVRSCCSQTSPTPRIRSDTNGLAKTTSTDCGIRKPIDPLRLVESDRADGCGVEESLGATPITRLRAAQLISSDLLNANETVALETRAALATSPIRTRLIDAVNCRAEVES